MNRARFGVTLIAALVLAVALFVAVDSPGNRSGVASSSSENADESAEMRTTNRLRAARFEIAERHGQTAVDDTAAGGPRITVPGWGDEKVFSKYNDWEPNAAADPNSDHVYMVTTQYGGPKACSSCPRSTIPLRISSDGGHTFGKQRFICECPGYGWQADPTVATDAAGHVFALFLSNPFSVYFARSDDFGHTWTTPIQVAPGFGPGYEDHPWEAVSADGQDIYIGFNHRSNWQVSSHDGGLTWSDPIETSSSSQYYYALGGEVLPDGDVVMVDAAFSCCGPHTNLGPVDVVVVRSTDGGLTWTEQVVDTSERMPACMSPGCPKYQYGTEAAIGQNSDGNLLIAYTATRKPAGAERVYARTSFDHGATWGGAMTLSPPLAVAVFPQAAGGPGGKFAVAWADNRNGGRRFNTWERDTVDDGATWSPDAQISNLGHGAGYKHPAGYQFSYGDYFDIVINSVGQVFGVWGEGYGYPGPGGTWYNVQT